MKFAFPARATPIPLPTCTRVAMWWTRVSCPLNASIIMLSIFIHTNFKYFYRTITKYGRGADRAGGLFFLYSSLETKKAIIWYSYCAGSFFFHFLKNWNTLESVWYENNIKKKSRVFFLRCTVESKHTFINKKKRWVCICLNTLFGMYAVFFKQFVFFWMISLPLYLLLPHSTDIDFFFSHCNVFFFPDFVFETVISPLQPVTPLPKLKKLKISRRSPQQVRGKDFQLQTRIVIVFMFVNKSTMSPFIELVWWNIILFMHLDSRGMVLLSIFLFEFKQIKK